MRSTWAVLLFGFCLTSSTAAGLGCSDCSVSGQDPIVYEGGTTNSAKTVFQSSTLDEPYLHFPQGRIYQFYHGLKTAPHTVDIFVSFREQLTPGGDTTSKTNPNNVAPSAGNQAVIEVWNDEMIQIRNDTCENNFYVRLVAVADPTFDGSGGVGGERASEQ